MLRGIPGPPARGRVLAGLRNPRLLRLALQAVSGHSGVTEPVGEWMLDWLADTADALVGQAPGVAAELLTRAVASSPAWSGRHGWLASRLADALYRVGDRAGAEQVATRALQHTAEPDLLVDLHWTRAQCRMLAGASAESLATLGQALAAPGLSARHRARLLVLAARTYSHLGELETAGRVADTALEAASEAGDDWATGWLLHVLALVAARGGHPADALPLYDRALEVTQADPALTDLWLLLQINQAVALANLDRYEQAFAVARQARQLAGQVGTTFRLTQAHGALSQFLYETGRCAGRGGQRAGKPEGTRRGLQRARHRRRDRLPPRRDRCRAPSPRGGRLPRRTVPVRPPDHWPLYPGPQPEFRARRRAAGGPRRAGRRVRRRHGRTRGHRGPAA